MEEWEKNLTWQQKSNLERLKKGKFYKVLLEQGYIPFTPKWKNAQRNMNGKLRRKNAKNDPVLREKFKAQSKKNYWSNIEKNRERNKIKKREARAQRNNEINEKARERYERNRNVEAAKQQARRLKREPARDIRNAAKLFAEGLLGNEHFIERVNGAVERANSFTGEGCEKRGRPRREKSTPSDGSNRS